MITDKEGLTENKQHNGRCFIALVEGVNEFELKKNKGKKAYNCLKFLKLL